MQEFACQQVVLRAQILTLGPKPPVLVNDLARLLQQAVDRSALAELIHCEAQGHIEGVRIGAVDHAIASRLRNLRADLTANLFFGERILRYVTLNAETTVVQPVRLSRQQTAVTAPRS